MKVEITVLAKDKTPDKKLLSFINSSLKIPENNENHLGSKRKGIHGSTIYKLPFNNDLFDLLLSFKNIFIISKELIEEDIYKKTRTFRLRMIPTEYGWVDLSFFNSENERFVYSITHEGELMADCDKYPQFKKYIVELDEKNLYLF